MKPSLFPLIPAGILLVACATSSAAQISEDPVCNDLIPLIQAAETPVPFAELTDETATGSSMGYRAAPASFGLPDARRCFIYIAGTSEGVRGGGAHNKAECSQIDGRQSETITQDIVNAKRDETESRLKTCSMLADWTFTPADPTERISEAVWKKPGTETEVVAQRLTSIYSGKGGRKGWRSYEVNLTVRVPNPMPPKTE
jgi:hypothetical protein